MKFNSAPTLLYGMGRVPSLAARTSRARVVSALLASLKVEQERDKEGFTFYNG